VIKGSGISGEVKWQAICDVLGVLEFLLLRLNLLLGIEYPSHWSFEGGCFLERPSLLLEFY
jgi:hypothetical protein